MTFCGQQFVVVQPGTGFFDRDDHRRARRRAGVGVERGAGASRHAGGRGRRTQPRDRALGRNGVGQRVQVAIDVGLAHDPALGLDEGADVFR